MTNGNCLEPIKSAFYGFLLYYKMEFNFNFKPVKTE